MRTGGLRRVRPEEGGPFSNSQRKPEGLASGPLSCPALESGVVEARDGLAYGHLHLSPGYMEGTAGRSATSPCARRVVNRGPP